jgi:putative lipoic acid-binding regulatory protein
MSKLFLAIAVAALSVATSARAIDLTGTWNGSYSCTGFDGEPTKNKVKDSVLLVVQTGATLSAIIDNGSGGTYRGATIDATAKPTEQGETVWNACSTDPLPLADSASELVRLKVKVDPDKGAGTLSGVSYFEQPGNLLTCKLKYKRASTAPPKFAGCDAM